MLFFLEIVRIFENVIKRFGLCYNVWDVRFDVMKISWHTKWKLQIVY